MCHSPLSFFLFFFLMAQNSEKAIKKTTNKIIKTADDSGTKSLDDHKIPKQQNYVNETHVSDFLKALAYDPTSEHISAWTDALPAVRQSTSKKSKKRLIQEEAAKPNGLSYSLLQYPLMVTCHTLPFLSLTLS